jgi:hypothetical protein
MIKAIVAAAATTLLAAPSLAQTAETPIPASAMLSGFGSSDAPSVAVAWRRIDNNISCRSRARSKLLEFGAVGMPSPDENLQYGSIGSTKITVWCVDSVGAAFISAAGQSSSAVTEARDALYKAF